MNTGERRAHRDKEATGLWARLGGFSCDFCGGHVLRIVDADGEPLTVDANPDWAHGNVYILDRSSGAPWATRWANPDSILLAENRESGVPFHKVHGCGFDV